MQTSELIALGRMFDADESAQLQQLKQNSAKSSINTSASKFLLIEQCKK